MEALALLDSNVAAGEALKLYLKLSNTVKAYGDLEALAQELDLHLPSVDAITLLYDDHATDEVGDIKCDWAEWQKELPVRSRIIADLYERYAEWRVR
jgi:hypothetical protein